MQRTLGVIRAALGITGASVILANAGCADSERAADGGASPRGDGAVSDMDARVRDDARVPPDPLPDGAVEHDGRVPIDGSLELDPFPLDKLTCTGPNYDEDDAEPGYWGQCCARVMCYSPDAGAGCESAEVVRNDRFSFGSGDCNCGMIHGPYARPDDAQAEAGECCYAVPVVGCTGRPLSTEGGHLLAPVVSSTAWLA